MSCSPDSARDKLIVDSVHGDIHLSEREWQILDTFPFQRLRRLKQLQMGQVTYPSATHTRFAHSVGTLGVMARIIRAIKQSNGRKQLEKADEENLRMAALLHDIGHYPYSHLMEGIDKVQLTENMVDGAAPVDKSHSFDASYVPYPEHDEVGAEIVLAHKDLVKAIGGQKRAKTVGDIFTRSGAADIQWSKLIHSSLDMDRLDYLQRDSHACGVPYGNIDSNYLLNSMKISPTGMLGVTEKALHAAEQFLLARFFLHKTVYFHKTTFGIEEACRQLLRRMRDSDKFGMPRDGDELLKLVRSGKLAGFTDAYVDQLVHSALEEDDDVMKALANSIEARRPPKLLKEVQVLMEDDETDGYNAGATFHTRARGSLKRLAEKHGIPLGQFLLCQTKPLRLEPRGDKVSAEEVQSIPSEKEDDLIKVFVGAEVEPKSLVSIPHSLIKICGSYSWQAVRLYVVYEGSDRDAVIAELRAKVKDWNLPQ